MYILKKKTSQVTLAFQGIAIKWNAYPHFAHIICSIEILCRMTNIKPLNKPFVYEVEKIVLESKTCTKHCAVQ
jgi:hypothetical protein